MIVFFIIHKYLNFENICILKFLYFYIYNFFVYDFYLYKIRIYTIKRKENMKNVLNKLTSMNTIQKIQLILWIVSFAILILFVVLAATLTKGTQSYANILAGVGLLFGALLVVSLFTTAIFSYLNGKRGNK